MRWSLVFLALGTVLLVIGHGMGLFLTPPEAMMGEVGRILYAHVPTAWVALVVYLVAFVGAVGALWNGRETWDATVEAAVEVGVLLNAMLLVQGSIWARPTWGIWWTWDPRLTSAAVMFVSFIGVLVLRGMIASPSRRLVATSIATIVSFVNVPVVYFSVKWWRTLHQPWSSPETVDSPMILPLRVSAFGMLFLAVGFLLVRRSLALGRLRAELEGADQPARPAPLSLED